MIEREGERGSKIQGKEVEREVWKDLWDWNIELHEKGFEPLLFGHGMVGFTSGTKGR